MVLILPLDETLHQSRGETFVRIAELGEHPGAEDDTEAGLAGDDLSVRVQAKTPVHLGFEHAELLDQRGVARSDDHTHRLDWVKVLGADEHGWRHPRTVRGAVRRFVTVVIDLTSAP